MSPSQLMTRSHLLPRLWLRQQLFLLLLASLLARPQLWHQPVLQPLQMTSTPFRPLPQPCRPRPYNLLRLHRLLLLLPR
jgi:hypothetical protein